jgi:hypothetical protein
MTTSEIVAQVRWDAGLNILANVIGVPRSGASPVLLERLSARASQAQARLDAIEAERRRLLAG